MAQARRKKNQLTLGRQVQRFLLQGLRESGFLLLLAVALFLLLAIATFNPSDPGWTHTSNSLRIQNVAGIGGAWAADIAIYFFGYVAYGLPLALAYASWRLFRRQPVLDPELLFYRLLGIVVTVAAGCGLAHLIMQPISPTLTAGGIAGTLSAGFLTENLTQQISGTLMMLLLMAGISLMTDWSWMRMIDFIGKTTWVVCRALVAPFVPLRQQAPVPAIDDQPAIAATADTPDTPGWRERLHAWLRRKADVAGDDAVGTTVLAGRRGNRREPVIGPGSAAPRGGTAGATQIDLPLETLAAPPKSKRRSERASKQQAKQQPDDEFSAKLQPAAPVASGELPSLGLLDMAPDEHFGYTAETLNDMALRLKSLLLDFGVEVEVVNAIPGPVITRFELDPAPGVKVSQISNLSKDLARGLSVLSVRVVEVIPGKPYIGLEIPNEHRAVVYLSEILGAAAYRKSASPLTLALGKDIAGHPVVSDLGAMPHLLVAGTTGSGKSVALNAMLLSILFKATPEQVRLIMIDPKMLELASYEGIPHLLAPVVTDMKEASNALRWCVAEMERRYRLMAALQVRNIDGFNRKVGEAIKHGKPLPDPLFAAPTSLEEVPTLLPLPYIVVVIDELADMMMTVGKKVEELIVRLAQKARAAGIHLILATQRPSVDVITGLIKSNVPTRIGFQVASKVDSRTILDQSGAENLLGHGDMLYLPPGKGFPQRIHGAYVADHEVQQVVESLRGSGAPEYAESILAEPESEKPAVGEDGLATVDGETDPLYDQAVRIVIETRRPSISNVQRRLGVGYNRAARMVESMENAGIVGPQQSNGSREVLVGVPEEES